MVQIFQFLTTVMAMVGTSGNRQPLPFLHVHQQLINASLSLFTFKWQEKSLLVYSIECFEVEFVWSFVAQCCNGA